MIERFIQWIVEQPQVRIPILVAFIAILGAILGGFFTVLVYPLLKEGIVELWQIVLRKFKKGKFEDDYLDWVIEEHKYLPILPSTLVPITKIQLQEIDKLYISLEIVEASDNLKRIRLGKALKANSSLVIIGDPGAGKTTMLRFLTLNFARNRRKRSSAKDRIERAAANQKIKSATKNLKEEFGSKHSPLPIFVYLNRFRDVAKWTSGRSLLDAIRDELRTVDSLREMPENFFDEKLNKGECIFLFDAFDELGDKEAREMIASRVGQLASTAPKGNQFIVTSRIVGYDGQLAKYGFGVLRIQHLSWDLIRDLVIKWYTFLSEQNLGEQLLNVLKSNPRIMDLAINPMLLSLIALVQYIKRIIPDKRHLLYDECVKILVERRYAPPDVQLAYNNVLPGEEALVIVHEIAFSMHKMRLREVSRSELERIIIPAVLIKMQSSRASTVSSIDLLKNIEERSQLLVERGFDETGSPVMAFPHLTFQEYLTSVALIEAISLQGEKVISNNVINYYKSDQEWWEEVALLYAAQLNKHQRHNFLSRLYPEKIHS